MNLSAYDMVIRTLDKNKTWIDTSKKRILSREIEYRKYYTFLKKYIPRYTSTKYYIALTDSLVDGCKMFTTVMDNYGRIKINISSIFKESYLYQCENQSNVHIKLVEEQDDGEIYEICV